MYRHVKINCCYFGVKRSIIVPLLVFFIITVFSNCVFSQTTGNITVKAGVISRVSVLSKSDIDFGTDLIPGRSFSVDKNSVSAGSIDLAGQSGKQVSVFFGLPEALLNGKSSMPVSFADDDGIFLRGGSSAGEVFNPHTVNTTNFPPDGSMKINLGGSVHPAPVQSAGSYNGLITVNLQYTGN